MNLNSFYLDYHEKWRTWIHLQSIERWCHTYWSQRVSTFFSFLVIHLDDVQLYTNNFKTWWKDMLYLKFIKTRSPAKFKIDRNPNNLFIFSKIINRNWFLHFQTEQNSLAAHTRKFNRSSRHLRTWFNMGQGSEEDTYHQVHW